MEIGLAPYPFSKTPFRFALQTTIPPRPDGAYAPLSGLLGLRGRVKGLVQLPQVLPAINLLHADLPAYDYGKRVSGYRVDALFNFRSESDTAITRGALFSHGPTKFEAQTLHVIGTLATRSASQLFLNPFAVKVHRPRTQKWTSTRTKFDLLPSSPVDCQVPVLGLILASGRTGQLPFY